MKIIKRFLPILILLSLLVGILSGCEFGEYENQIYTFGYIGKNDENIWLNPEFAHSNRVYASFYWDSKLDYPDVDRTSPRSRSFVIQDRKTYNEVFLEGAIDVDFETEMIVLYTETSTAAETYDVGDISIDENGELNVQIYILRVAEEEKEGFGNGTMPVQKYFAVKIQKRDISDVNFVFDKKFVTSEYWYEKCMEEIEILDERKEEYDSLNSNNSK